MEILLEKLIDIQTIQLCITISLFVVYLVSKWSKK